MLTAVTAKDIKEYGEHKIGCSCKLCKKVERFRKALKEETKWRLTVS